MKTILDALKYFIGIFIIAYVYALLSEESYLKSFAIVWMIHWLSTLHLHFLGIIKWGGKKELF